jgi:hypothetical protein
MNLEVLDRGEGNCDPVQTAFWKVPKWDRGTTQKPLVGLGDVTSGLKAALYEHVPRKWLL